MSSYPHRCECLTALLVLFALMNFAESVHAQASDPGNSQRVEASSISQAGTKREGAFIVDLLKDQKHFWTSPLRLRLSDAEWLVPAAGITTGLMMTDRTTAYQISRQGGHTVSDRVANYGLAGLGLSAATMYMEGVRRGKPKLRETGLLSAEAGFNALAINESLKFAFRRDLPSHGDGAGRFFQSSSGNSFPSNHATLAFSIATVISHEYPGPLTKVLTYGSATAIGFARVNAQRHFPSDVFVGSTLGYLIGESVYRRHHDPGLDLLGTFESGRPLDLSEMSSTYIELDSWIYPAVERLAALGVVRYEFLGLRPWTRLAVLRMIDGILPDELDETSAHLLTALKTELKRESSLNDGQANNAITVDRVYSRTQNIAGQPLTDSFHFGQTITNDFGRPYSQGWQQLNGFEARAENGRFSFFVRGEYQHTPSALPYPASALQAIYVQDSGGTPSSSRSGFNEFRLLDTYASMRLLGHDISVGKQSYWWAPNDSAAMSLSNNVEPFYSVRIKRSTPLYIPLLSKLVGPLQYDNFFGRLSGNQSPPNVYVYGQKVILSPTRDLEIGFSRNAVIGGSGPNGSPLTFGNFWSSFISTSSGTYQLTGQNRLGMRHGGFDFRYRLPFLRNWVTLYADSVMHDDISPIDAPRHAAWMPGVYVAKFPRLPKLDLHVEGGSSDIPARAKGGQYYYYEYVYHDGYTNKGQLLGSWIGREGTGGQAWATYWFSPESTLVAGYRTLKVSPYFVPSGLSQTDVYTRVRHARSNGLTLDVMLQVERWRAPVLSRDARFNFTTQIQVSYRPRTWGAGSR